MHVHIITTGDIDTETAQVLAQEVADTIRARDEKLHTENEAKVREQLDKLPDTTYGDVRRLLLNRTRDALDGFGFDIGLAQQLVGCLHVLEQASRLGPEDQGR